MTAKYVAGTFIKTIQHGSRQIVLEYVSETTSWKRTYIDPKVLDEFCAVAERNVASLRPDTVYVSMQENDHPSPREAKSHFSVLELDNSKSVMASRHMYKK